MLLLFESVPTEQRSSVEETGVAAAVVVTTRPQLGRPLPSTACEIPGCVAQKPGLRLKHWLHWLLGVKTQPLPAAVATHVSSVQVLLSLQGACGVKTQPSPGAVGTQVSVVQLLLSLHGACGVKVQPSPGAVGTQVSFVQLLVS